MRMLSLVLVVLSWATLAVAAPAKKDAAAFVKALEAAVKANSKAIGGGSEAVRKHNQRYSDLYKKRQALFVDADACSFASDSARSLWQSQQQYSRRPDQLGLQFLERRQEDYQDNMKACKQSLRTMH